MGTILFICGLAVIIFAAAIIKLAFCMLRVMFFLIFLPIILMISIPFGIVLVVLGMVTLPLLLPIILAFFILLALPLLLIKCLVF